MTFRDTLKSDVSNVILNTDECAETVTYTPYGQSSKSINAFVIRDQLESSDQSHGHVLSHSYEAFISTDAVTGVASVTKGEDRMTFPVIEGGGNREWVVLDIIHKDDGVWHLLVGD